MVSNFSLIAEIGQILEAGKTGSINFSIAKVLELDFLFLNLITWGYQVSPVLLRDLKSIGSVLVISISGS